jgi:hypothetical protein
MNRSADGNHELIKLCIYWISESEASMYVVKYTYMSLADH